MKKIGSACVYVQFDFGSMVNVSVPLYEGKTFNECVKLRSDKICGYLSDEGEWINLESV